MKQLKYVQGKTIKEPNLINSKNAQVPRTQNVVTAGNSLAPGKSSSIGQVKLQSKSGKVSQNVNKTTINSRKKPCDVAIKKGDMAEFLRRKEIRQMQIQDKNEKIENEIASTESSGRLRDIGCQTVETNLGDKIAQVTSLYSRMDELNIDSRMKASGDTDHNRNLKTVQQELCTSDVPDHVESPQARSRLNAILEKKDNKDPYLPCGYQKGVVPKYLHKHKDQSAKVKEDTSAHEVDPNCPPGHVTLPDTERKETLRMLRNSFAELVSELNKMPVKTDTLRMRNKKMELEKQLAKLEEGIKVFSRPKVFVKIE
ncbi:Enkurin domain-containing protein 1 [Eumeta japonica]|uniref:Enkurin domain-containing protein 1 n=1 Tax=Eumeta variegata TaxID=151549 RepID=A0A4C1TWG9_EUMVA|nr:Enkurin domain-containing protein 1 [Eumeta japonica]